MCIRDRAHVEPVNPALFLPANEESTPDSKIFTNIEDGTLSAIYDEVIGEITISEIEHEMIERTLKKFRGNRRRTAKALDISERTLYRKINEYNISKTFKKFF